MVTFVPRDGVNVRDPRIRVVQGAMWGSDLLKEKLTLSEHDPAALQLLRHVRRGELDAGDAFTAQLAGVSFVAPAQTPAKKGDK